MVPLNGPILQALSGGPRRIIDLRRECGSPAPTTLRAHLHQLDELGAVFRRRRDQFPGTVEYQLTPAGRELLFVVAALERWLRLSPNGPRHLGKGDARAAVKALVDAWSSSMLRVLAARPVALTELDRVIEPLGYPALERRLAAMRQAGQVEPQPGASGRTTPYGVTRWVRQGIAPLAAAAQWERRHLRRDAVPITPVDIEAAFLLTLPLLHMPSIDSASCRLGVEVAGGGRRLAGAIAHVSRGRVTSCTVRLNGKVDAWAIGSASAWLHAVLASDTDGLELGGDQQLARQLLDRLHEALFGPG